MRTIEKQRLLKKLLRKAVAALLCLLFVTLINFLLPRLMPGDPVLMLTGMDEEVVSAELYSQYRAKLGLDQPFLTQLGNYLAGLLHGELGYSYHYEEAVSTLLLRRIPNTLQLAIPALVFSSLLAVGLGCAMGYRQGGRLERAVTSVMILLDATPGFLLGMVAVYLFGFTLGWLPLGGMSAMVPPPGAIAALLDRLWHLLLPVAVLTLGSLPGKYLLLKNAVAGERERPYLLYAKARGIGEGRIQYLHLFKNICPPFIALLGVNIGFILSGSMVCEALFSIKGMGELFYSATAARDFPTMQGCLLVTALAVIAATMAADVVNLLMDPKVRSGADENE